MLIENKNILQLFDKIEKENLLQELILQINKDIRMVGIDFELIENSNPKDVVLNLKNLLHKLINNNFSDFINLLYRIDVSEKQIAQLQVSDTALFVEKSAILMLKKEWQKVWFRSKNR